MVVVENATKPSRFAHFPQDRQSLAPATPNDIWASKSCPRTPHFDFKCALHHNGVHCFDIATSKSGLTLRRLYILTSKCASRPNGVQSSDISTSKRGPTLRCFEGEQYRCTAAKMRPTTVCQIVYKCKTKAETFQPHRYMNFSKGRLSAEIFEYWRYLFYRLIYFVRFIFFIFLFCDLFIFILFFLHFLKSSHLLIFPFSYPHVFSFCPLALLPSCPLSFSRLDLLPSWILVLSSWPLVLCLVILLPYCLLSSCSLVLLSCPLVFLFSCALTCLLISFSFCPLVILPSCSLVLLSSSFLVLLPSCPLVLFSFFLLSSYPILTSCPNALLPFCSFNLLSSCPFILFLFAVLSSCPLVSWPLALLPYFSLAFLTSCPLAPCPLLLDFIFFCRWGQGQCDPFLCIFFCEMRFDYQKLTYETSFDPQKLR